MKIAYLMHCNQPFDEIVENINQLIKQQDHVFVMINEQSRREEISFAFGEDNRVHISNKAEFAQEGDMSLARGTIFQLKEACDMNCFDYYINLTDGMIPIKNRNEIINILKQNKDFYEVYKDELTNPEMKEEFKRFTFFTNIPDFDNKSFTKKLSKGMGNLAYKIGFKRDNEVFLIKGSPYFMLRHQTARVLADNLPFVADTFKLLNYAEDYYIPTMIKHFIGEDDHINNNYHIVGPDGHWIENQGSKKITRETILKHPDALFAGRIFVNDDLTLYEDYFETYNN
ncbi:MAG: beta-1,6-N-acetylglucosaminyltransferase [Erysipelotrichaceae bacterium]